MAGRNDERLRCSFCGKTQDQVRKLIAGPNGAYICDECVDVCAEIIDEELENDEFDGNVLDKSKWSYWENGNPWKDGNYLDENGNLVDQYGFNAKQYYLRDNVRTEDGNLIIEIKKEETKTVKIDGADRRILYSSGAIHTKDKYSVKY